MRPHLPRHSRGATLIITVLILTAILLDLAIEAGSELGAEFQVSIALQNKKIAESTATGCTEHAIETLGLNGSYAGNETLAISGNSCTIRSITFAGSAWTIETESRVGQSIARFRTVLSRRAPVTIVTWEEIAL